MRTEDQINASRINGSKSDGATSEEGQNRCKTAAFKHGLTSEHVVVAPEEVEAYNNLVEITFDHYRPMSPMEKIVIQEVANLGMENQQSQRLRVRPLRLRPHAQREPI